MSPEAIILEQQYERHLLRRQQMINDYDTMTISLEAHDKTWSFKLDDGSTWREVLDCFVRLLNASGYQITNTKLVDWSEDTDAGLDE